MKHKSGLKLTKDTLYITLNGEIWGVYSEDREEMERDIRAWHCISTLTAANAGVLRMLTIMGCPPISLAIPQGSFISRTSDIIHENGSGARPKMSLFFSSSLVIAQHSAGHQSIDVAPFIVTNCPPTYDRRRQIIIWFIWSSPKFLVDYLVMWERVNNVCALETFGKYT